MEQITSQAGVAPDAAGYAMLIGSIVGTFVTPLSLALWMVLGFGEIVDGQTHPLFVFLGVGFVAGDIGQFDSGRNRASAVNGEAF